jgi:hypothetical protein
VEAAAVKVETRADAEAGSEEAEAVRDWEGREAAAEGRRSELKEGSWEAVFREVWEGQTATADAPVGKAEDTERAEPAAGAGAAALRGAAETQDLEAASEAAAEVVAVEEEKEEADTRRS